MNQPFQESILITGSTTRVGAAPDDWAALGVADKPSWWESFLGDASCFRKDVRIDSFRMMPDLITKRMFLDHVFSKNYFRPVAKRDASLRFWEEVSRIPGYGDDFPILGVEYDEAVGFSHSIGGRLPFEEELECLVNRVATSGFPQPYLAGRLPLLHEVDTRLFFEQFKDLVSIRDLRTMPTGSSGVSGLFGCCNLWCSGLTLRSGENCSQPSLDTSYVYTWSGVMKAYSMYNTRALHSGARLPPISKWLPYFDLQDGIFSRRGFPIQVASFFVAFDWYENEEGDDDLIDVE